MSIMSITTRTAWSRDNIASSREEAVKRGFEVYTTGEPCEKGAFFQPQYRHRTMHHHEAGRSGIPYGEKQQPERRQSPGRLRGFGTTLIACEKYGRHGRLMEYDPKYADVIVRCWQTYTGKQATHEAAGQLFDDMTTHEQRRNGSRGSGERIRGERTWQHPEPAAERSRPQSAGKRRSKCGCSV